jgi:hypothetical protein
MENPATKLNLPAKPSMARVIYDDFLAGRISKDQCVILLETLQSFQAMRRDVVSVANPKRSVSPNLPDASWVKKNITLFDISKCLGIEMTGRHIRCPRDGSHWANVHVKTNGLKCFKCPHQPYWSNINLVMEITGLNFPAALRWFEARWDAPWLPCVARLIITRPRW